MKIPPSGADCSKALCGSETDIAAPENLWEIKQKKGHSNNFKHYYDEPRDYHVPVHDEGDEEACSLPGRLGCRWGSPQCLMLGWVGRGPSPENRLLCSGSVLPSSLSLCLVGIPEPALLPVHLSWQRERVGQEGEGSR